MPEKIATKAGQEDRAPRAIDGCAGDPLGQVGIVGNVLGVVREVQNAGSAVEEQEPRQGPAWQR
jgi:hypothetical protein